MEKSVLGVYKATNIVNGNSYIGQTSRSFEKRKRKHINVSKKLYNKTAFCNAIRKYREENFIWCVVEYCNSKYDLDLAEEWYIRKYRTYVGFDDCRGYNLTLGGGGSVGYIPSKEALENLSKSHIGIKMPAFTEEHKRRISMALKGKRLSDQHKKSVSLGRRNICVGANNHASKKYVITSPDGKEFFVHSLLNFCKNYKECKLDFRNLSACAVGKRNHHKGYKCRYYNLISDVNIHYWVNN